MNQGIFNLQGVDNVCPNRALAMEYLPFIYN